MQDCSERIRGETDMTAKRAFNSRSKRVSEAPISESMGAENERRQSCTPAAASKGNAKGETWPCGRCYNPGCLIREEKNRE